MVVWYSLCIELRLFIVVPLACGCAVINEIHYKYNILKLLKPVFYLKDINSYKITYQINDTDRLFS